MSNQQFRWRTVVEVAVISVVIYVLAGAPGRPASLKGTSTDHERVPVAIAKTENLVCPAEDLQCSKDAYDTHIFSRSPLVIYVDGFLSEAEADHFVDIRYIR